MRLRPRERVQPDVLGPLFAAYFAFAAYYVWQAWRRETPAIFTDELEFTQISRAIAHTGSPARREEAYHFTSLYPYFTAPAWWWIIWSRREKKPVTCSCRSAQSKAVSAFSSNRTGKKSTG